VAALSGLAAALTSPATARATVERTIWDGVYTAEQADRGQVALNQRCAACHKDSEWSTPTFISRWSGRPILTLYDNIRLTMPYNSPARLSRELYSDIVACLLRLNGAPPGNEPLPSDAEGLEQIAVTPRPDR
jgi:hypothetical protein